MLLKADKVKVEEAMKAKEEELKKKTSEYVKVEETKLEIQQALSNKTNDYSDLNS